MIALGLILYALGIAALLVFFTACKRGDELDFGPYRIDDAADQPDRFDGFVTGARSHDDDVAPPIAGGEG